MCGIAGHVDWSGNLAPSAIQDIATRIRHRGPDDAGLWRSADGACVLGHARLSIVDLTPTGHQPMVASNGVAIVFNGEVYNFPELRRDCESAGYRFVSTTDTEVILALYQRYGVGCLQFLRGMFAFAIWDAEKRCIFLARDRVGKKPLFYHVGGRHLIFASEIDALARHPEIPKQTDLEALELYLQLQYIPHPWSIYKSIRKLPPAHFALFDSSGLTLTRYWDVSYRQKDHMSEVDALDGLEEKLKSAVRMRMIADVPIGALLSGGVDSSIVVALMSGMEPKAVRTYSIGFEQAQYNELPFAEAVATKYATEHVSEIVGGEVEPLLGTVVRHYGEPFADTSAIPSFRVAAAARRHVKVVLNGDGGDELLGGYPRYWLPWLSIRTGKVLKNWHSPNYLADLLVGLEKASRITQRARRKWLLRVSHPEIQSVGMYTEFWNDEERSQLIGGSTRLLHEWRTKLLTDVREAADDPIDRMLWIDNRSYLPGDLLAKMDIAAMHCGLEARSPFLDHEVIEFCAALPTSLKVRHGIGKYLLKKLAERYLPLELVYRRKMGFGVPLSDWLQGPLRQAVNAVLMDRECIEPLSHRVAQSTWRSFLSGASEHQWRIWSIFMFGLWRRNCLNAQG